MMLLAMLMGIMVKDGMNCRSNLRIIKIAW